MIEKTQINGGFYNQKAIKMAVEGSLSFFNLKTQSVEKLPTSVQKDSTKATNGLLSE